MSKAMAGNQAARDAMAEREAAYKFFARKTGLPMDYIRTGPTSERLAALDAYRNRRGAKAPAVRF